MQKTLHHKTKVDGVVLYPTLKEVLAQFPCERCADLNNFNKCDPENCIKLEDLAINLGTFS